MNATHLPYLHRAFYEAGNRSYLRQMQPAQSRNRLGKQLARVVFDPDRADRIFWFSLFTCGAAFAVRIIWQMI